MITASEAAPRWYELAALWAPSLVAIAVAVLAFWGAMAVRRGEAKQSRDEKTRQAAADVLSAAIMLLRAAIRAHEQGQPEIWNHQPGAGDDRNAYERYNDALEHAYNCNGVLTIWRPELAGASGSLIRAFATYEGGDKKKEQGAAQSKARKDFLAAVRQALGDSGPPPKM
ncbi:hypothetical protein APR04_005970 [Promicromonospora umidemergens]|uniref:DUF4760 domain-containing protein n=1 Tax=Promicromonospora umidemergens TaxID=629679 RepID=A0ABP8XUK9_9MICO|nr:hypothetical protein [Promicromonospora umidemergens]MCP2287023.1 hypothetical protein [Promicromonospora umidemergens]